MTAIDIQCQKVYKLFKYICFVVIFMNGVIPIVMFLLLGLDDLSFQMLMPIDHKKHFILTNTLQFSFTVAPFMTNITHNLLYYTLSSQLVAYMKVLEKRLRDEKISNETIRLHQSIIK